MTKIEQLTAVQLLGGSPPTYTHNIDNRHVIYIIIIIMSKEKKYKKKKKKNWIINQF